MDQYVKINLLYLLRGGVAETGSSRISSAGVIQHGRAGGVSDPSGLNRGVAVRRPAEQFCARLVLANRDDDLTKARVDQHAQAEIADQHQDQDHIVDRIVIPRRHESRGLS